MHFGKRENEFLSMTNPSRMAPRIFLQIPAAVEAISRELSGLMKKDRYGAPALLRIKLDEEEYRGIRRIHSTMVVKKNLRMPTRQGYAPGAI